MSDWGVHVYVGDYATHKVPEGVVIIALALNRGKPLTDLRTRGAKLIESWGKSKDAEIRTTIQTA